MSRITLKVLASLLLSSLTVCAQDSPFTPAQTERYNRLTHELISPCCWRECIAIHRSEEALQMLNEVHQLVGEGKSEDEIKAMYVQRYGVRILADPPGIVGDWLYSVPVVLFGYLPFLAIRRLRWLGAQAPHSNCAQSPDLIARVRIELGELG